LLRLLEEKAEFTWGRIKWFYPVGIPGCFSGRAMLFQLTDQIQSMVYAGNGLVLIQPFGDIRRKVAVKSAT